MAAFKYKNDDIRKEKFKQDQERYLELAKDAIDLSIAAYDENKIEVAHYWLKLADIYCKLIIAENDN